MKYKHVADAARYLADSLSKAPTVGLILGSGLGQISEQIETPSRIPYAAVPYMARSTAPGHAGCFICGNLGGIDVICMQGRLHAYEGHSAADIAFPVFVMHRLGVDTLLITNATGGINTSYEVGDIVLIEDHLNLTGMNPLVGPDDPRLGPRFNDMTQAYSPRLRAIAKQAAADIGMELREGVYAGDLGPSFETPAEIRAMRTLGADVVGMSTVFEVIAAANCGMETCVLSLVTNMAAGVLDVPITAEEVSEVGARRAVAMCSLISQMLKHL